MRYRNDVIRLVFLLHICANLGMMLARDYASCHVARSTVTFNVCSKQRAKNSDGLQKVLNLNPIDHLLVGPIKAQGSCTFAATKSRGAHACYSSNVCGHFITLYS